MRKVCLIFALLAGACVLGGCAQSRPRSEGVSSETHFLRSCSGDSCGKGLSCVCGACTKTCDATSACTALAKDAVCAAPAGDACDEGHTCDVKCSAKADCAQLGDAYACEDGRCRAPASPSKPSANDAGAKDDASVSCGTSGPGLVFCALESVAQYGQLCSPQQVDCGTLPIAPSMAEQASALDCVRRALDSESPFRLIWQVQGTDSQLESGLVGVSKNKTLPIYFLSYDSLGAGGPTSHWLECLTFSLRDGCTGELNTCFECGGLDAPQPKQSCTCTEPDPGHGRIQCPDTQPDGGTIVEPTACADNACNFDGVCYPDQTGTEDGCCFCDKQGGGGSCIEPGWCPGWVLISKRCTSDDDCRVQASTDSGLQCRKDFFGGRGVCTRDCNYGCPTGTECVAEAPDNDGGTIKNVCLRPCTAQADCAMEVRGSPLGSECDASGDLTDPHCF